MHSDSVVAALKDMDHHIRLAAGFVEGVDFERFREDTRTLFAVTAFAVTALP